MDNAKCEAIGCPNIATHYSYATYEVAAWRRPESAKPEDQCFECGPLIGLCDEHENLHRFQEEAA
jgi:hypothetical protein